MSKGCIFPDESGPQFLFCMSGGLWLAGLPDLCVVSLHVAVVVAVVIVAVVVVTSVCSPC